MTDHAELVERLCGDAKPEAAQERREIVERLGRAKAMLRHLEPEDDALTAASMIDDAIAALQQESLRAVVKPLEWKHAYADEWSAEAGDFEVFYKINNVGSGFHCGFWGTAIGPLHPSLDEAKAAAQADYEARINSALAHPLHQPAPEAEPAAWRTIAYDGSWLLCRNRNEALAQRRSDNDPIEPLYAVPQAPVPDGVTVPDGLIDALRHQRQIDLDGTEVGVSRQACDQAAAVAPPSPLPMRGAGDGHEE